MNKAFTYILVGGASALAGAVAGYIFCKKELQHRFDKELEDAINEEISAIRKRNKRPAGEEKDESTSDRMVDGIQAGLPIVKQAARKVAESTLAAAKEALGVVSPSKEFIAHAEDLIRNEFPDESLNGYRVMTVASAMAQWMDEGLTDDEATERLNELMASFEYPTEDDEDPNVDEDDIEDEDPQAVMEEYMDKPPEIVSEHDYRRLPPYFDFVTFHYYEEDDVLTDDKDMVVDDVDRVVGDALTHFGPEAAEMNDGDDDVVYVVNGDYGLAIEIERIHSSYEAWLGR